MPESVKVLAADDEEAVRLFLETLLERQGWKCVVVKDGFQAAAVLRGWTPDIVLTDWQMPGNRRFEVLQTLRETAPHTPAIILSGDRGQDQIPPHLREVLFAWLDKPVSSSRLLQTIRQALTQTQRGRY